MAERTGGAHAALSNARVYTKFVDLVSGPGRPNFVRDHIRPKPGDRILDIGCGPGSIFALMPPGVEYIGFDHSPTYIESAKQRFGEQAEFHCLDVQDAELPAESFDLVVVMGVLHHLGDDAARSLLRLASRVLVDSGRMAVLEAVYIENQPRLARFVIGLDRGTSIRSPEEYDALADPYFASVDQTIRSDLLRIPYTHSILECAEPRRDSVQAG